MDTIDVYKIADLYEINDNRQFHALKKILCAGKRGAKDKRQDMEEAMQSIQNWLDNDEAEINTQDFMVAQAKNYPWAKWIAQDADGAWYAYSAKPSISDSNGKWHYKVDQMDNECLRIGYSYPTDWKNSLCRVRD